MEATEQIRVFFSFHVPEGAAENLVRYTADSIAYTPYLKENFHITLLFIGEVTVAELENLGTVAEVLASHIGPLAFIPKELFVEDGRLRLAMEADEELFVMHDELVKHLNELGIGKKETRPYRPHVTLGRLSKEISSLPSLNLSQFAFTATSFGLYKSESGENKTGVYTLLREFALKK